MATTESDPSAFSPEMIEDLRKDLVDISVPIEKRFRALFTLRGVGTKPAIDAMKSALDDPSALLRHEVAYCLGQMGDAYAFPILCDVLAKAHEHPMVRHEAAEAIGALTHPEALAILRRFENDPVREVAETCQLALSRVKYFQENSPSANPCSNPDSVYLCVDPAPPYPPAPTPELKAKLLSQDLPIFDRYRALFALRDAGSEDAVLALCEAFGDSSALLKHEIAFVLGQLQHSAAVPSLLKVIEKTSESAMVRHEAAEALGAIAADIALPILQKYAKDEEPIVSESCIVALDVHEYFNSDQFQYADGIKLQLEKKQDQIKTGSN